MPTTDFAARVDSTLDSIQADPEIHPDNKEAIAQFKRDLQLDEMSDAWLQKLTSHLKILAEHVGNQRFEDMTTEDIKDLVGWVQQREKDNGDQISDATVSAYKQVIKRFWRWMYDMPEGEHPEQVDWVNTSAGRSNNDTLPTDLLTREDIDALKAGCRNDRDRAFIAVLYETGARIGELIDLTVGDIEDNTRGRKVVVDGKTGERRLLLVESDPALNKWLNGHPDPKQDAPLWCKLTKPDKLSYHYIRQKLLVRAGERAAKANPEQFAEDPDADELSFHKPLNPHHFRHSRATELAARDEFNEYKLCQWFGWTTSSDVPAKYIHLSGADIDDAYSRMHGLVPEDDEEDPNPIEPCPRCEELNEREDRFCSRCGHALDEDAADELEVAEEKVTNVSSDTDAALAMQLVKAIREDKGQITEFVEQLE